EATDWLYTVAWSGDGKWLAAGGVDKSIRVYEPGPASARLVHSVFAHEGPVQKLVFAADSQTLYSAGQDRVVKAWDVGRMVERRVYDAQSETILALAVRPDGQQVAVGRYDGLVRLLDSSSGILQAAWGQAGERKDPLPQPAPAPPPLGKKITPDL